MGKTAIGSISMMVALVGALMACTHDWASLTDEVAADAVGGDSGSVQAQDRDAGCFDATGGSDIGGSGGSGAGGSDIGGSGGSDGGDTDGAAWADSGNDAAGCGGDVVACPGSGCVDVRKDNQNCGSCGNACKPSRRCVEGVCAK